MLFTFTVYFYLRTCKRFLSCVYPLTNLLTSVGLLKVHHKNPNIRADINVSLAKWIIKRLIVELSSYVKTNASHWQDRVTLSDDLKRGNINKFLGRATCMLWRSMCCAVPDGLRYSWQWRGALFRQAGARVNCSSRTRSYPPVRRHWTWRIR